ncbi:MAG TPA: aspartate/glutamate racemase family protein [Bryobacteraceae bacterium]|nr:aspartate/glutamate racemase family protein [Bryobacteraceae bacterium]
MNRTFALIHTSPVLVPMFTALAARHLPGVRVFHMVDESLIANTIRAGSLEKATVRRIVNQVESARQAGADAVMVTCSSIGAAVPVARQLFDFPILRIDERLAEESIRQGPRIGVLATLRTTLEPTVALLEATAARLGQPVDLTAHLCEGAFEAVLAGDTATHDKAVAAGLRTLALSNDVVVLAQASMARVIDAMGEDLPPLPILSSPALAMSQAQETLNAI